MSVYYRKEQYREKLFIKNLHLKTIRENLFKILPRGSVFGEFLQAFKKYFPCEWDDIVSYCKSRKWDYFRRKKKGLRTVSYDTPENFLRNHVSLERLGNNTLSGKCCVDFIAKLQKKANAKKKHRENKLKKNMVTVQQVCPSYVKSLINLYFDVRKKNTLDVNARYLILLEASNFKCNETISFLQKVNACDKNDDLRYLAFLSLQRIGEYTWLARKRKGKQCLSQIKPIDIQKNPTELLHFICKYQHVLYQEYDVFLSHSSLDTKELLKIKAELNKQGLTVYIDWVNDDVMLDRKNQNEDTWNVLETRMEQSKLMIYVMTDNSIQSSYAKREVIFFKKKKKSVFVLSCKTSLKKPIYLDGCPQIQVCEVSSLIPKRDNQ